MGACDRGALGATRDLEGSILKTAVVIGGGPAGIAVGACLEERGIASIILESGSVPLAGLRKIDPAMKLLTPARLSALPGMSLPYPGGTYLDFATLVGEFDRYIEQRGLDIRTGSRVHRVDRTDRGFRVALADDQLDCDYVVDASGMISTPHYPPRFDPRTSSIPWKHSIDVRPHHLSSAKRLLVIGSGTSAFEVLASWLAVRPTDGRAWMSHRAPLACVPHRVLGIDVHYLVWLPEHLPGHLPGVRRLFDREPAIGIHAVGALLRRQIRVVPQVDEFGSGWVALANGRLIEPDFIVFATGFTHAARHLGSLVDRDHHGRPVTKHCESTVVPGLFVLGVKFARNLASPFLRGIARDAVVVADRIEQRARVG